MILKKKDTEEKENKKKWRKTKKEKKYKMTAAARLFFVLTMIFFVALLIDTSICLSVSPKSIYRFAYSYVSDKEIPTEYASFFIEKGFTEDDYLAFFKSEDMKKTVSGVLADRMSVVFHYTEEFEHDEESVKADIKALIKETAKNKDVSLSDEDIDQLTVYVTDISGISSMFRFSTPEEYRKALLTDENHSDGNEILYVIYSVTRPVVVFVLYIMTFILTAITALLIWKDPDRAFTLGNIFLYPSIVVLGFSIGEVFGNVTAGVITKFFFRYLLWVSVAGILYGILVIVIIKLIQKFGKRAC